MPCKQSVLILMKYLLYWKNSLSTTISFLGVWEYIQETRDQVFDLEQRVQKAKDNVEKINKIMTTWVLPIFERKENKKVRTKKKYIYIYAITSSVATKVFV